jgi:hypothetical protein
MYTENLVNLFGGDGDKKKNNTAIIIGIVVLICIVVFGGGFFMMNKKKKDNKDNKDNKEEKKVVDCSKYTDDASGVPLECYEKVWKDVGCTEDFYKVADQSKGDLLPSLGQFKESMILTKSNPVFKQVCYGFEKLDPSSKCAEYNNESTNISDECINELYLTNCPGFDLKSFKDTHYDNNNNKIDFKTLTFSQHRVMADYYKALPENEYKVMCEKADPSGKCAEYNNESTNISDECITEIFSKDCPGFDLNAFKNFNRNGTEKLRYFDLKWSPSSFKDQPSDISKEICYGPDKSKWPEACSYFKDESKWVDGECIKNIWTNAGCTKEEPSYEYSKTLKEIKDDINNISTSSDPAIKSKCN